MMAMDKNGAIGLNNSLPWYLPSDLAYFKKLTTDKVVVMGRKTFESIGKPLPDRHNIVLTRDPEPTYLPTDVVVYNSVHKLRMHYTDEELYVIGGANIYKVFLPNADALYITHIDHAFKADTFIDIDFSKWVMVSNIKGNDDVYPHSYAIYKRRGL